MNDLLPPADTRPDPKIISSVFKLLSHPNRLLIAAELAHGERSVSEIERKLGISQPALSRDLARFRDAGIVETRRHSKIVFYRLTNSAPAQLLMRILNAAEWPLAATAGGRDVHLAVDNNHPAPPTKQLTDVKDSAAFADVPGNRRRRARLARISDGWVNSSR